MDIEKFLIEESCTVIKAMEKLDKVARKVLFIVKEKKLIAAITDGDIRRWILNKGDLESEVSKVANYNPKFFLDENKKDYKKYMRKHNIEAMPIVDKNKNIISIVFWNDVLIATQNKIDLPVVIMAGGLGTRLYPYTKILPKPLIPIGEVPIAEHIINRFVKSGSKDFFLVVNHKKNMIKSYFNEIEKEYSIEYAEEEEFLGTGGGLSLLKGKIDKTFFLSNCDILIDEDYEKIYRHHKEQKNLITMVCSLKNIRIPYGVIDIGENGEIGNMREKPEISFFTNTGMYIVEPKVIEELENNKVISFPDIIEHYKKQGEKVGVYPISENSWMDMGQLDEMEEMRRRLEDE